MHIDHIIEQCPELGITKKIETRSVHRKDDHLDDPVGKVKHITIYTSKEGNSLSVADIEAYYKACLIKEKWMAKNMEEQKEMVLV